MINPVVLKIDILACTECTKDLELKGVEKDSRNNMQLQNAIFPQVSFFQYADQFFLLSRSIFFPIPLAVSLLSQSPNSHTAMSL